VTFCRPVGQRSRRNKAIFEIWAHHLGALSEDDWVCLLQAKEELLAGWTGLFDDPVFSKAVSQATGVPGNVHHRFLKTADLIDAVLI
jgi:hypothetical protein